MLKLQILSLFLAFALAGCSLLSPKLKTPNTDFNISSECVDCDKNLSFDRNWWLLFNDEKLNALVNRALEKNNDLRLAFINYERAAANLGISRSDLLPKLNGTAGATRQKTPVNSPSNSSGNAIIGNSYNMGLSLSYELDLWGKYRDNYLAGRRAFEASIYDFEAARLTLISSVVNLYFNAINLYNQEQILTQSVADYQQSYDLRKEQFDVGAISEYELYSYKAQLDSAKANLENARLAKDSNDKALLILIGADLNEVLYTKFSNSKIENYDISLPSGISSEILLMRPDIASSLKSLEQKNYLVGAARADFLPSISLTGLLGFASSHLNNLTENPSATWSVGGSAVMPIFRWGEIAYNVDLAKLSKDEAYLSYENTLKTAFGEVRTALLSYETASNNELNYKNLLEAQQKIYELSQARYDSGAISLNDLLDARNNYLNAKLSYENAIYVKISAVIESIKAFGGGFRMDKTQARANLNEDSQKLDLSFQ